MVATGNQSCVTAQAEKLAHTVWHVMPQLRKCTCDLKEHPWLPYCCDGLQEATERDGEIGKI